MPAWIIVIAKGAAVLAEAALVAAGVKYNDGITEYISGVLPEAPRDWGVSTFKRCETDAKKFIFNLDPEGRYVPKRFIPSELDAKTFDENNAQEFLQKTAASIEACKGEKKLARLDALDINAGVIKEGWSPITNVQCARELTIALKERYEDMTLELKGNYTPAWIGDSYLDCDSVNENFIKEATAPIFEGACYTYSGGYIVKDERDQIREAEDAYRKLQACASVAYANYRIAELIKNTGDLYSLAKEQAASRPPEPPKSQERQVEPAKPPWPRVATDVKVESKPHPKAKKPPKDQPPPKKKCNEWDFTCS